MYGAVAVDGDDGTQLPFEALRRAKFSIPAGPARAIDRPALVASFLESNGARSAPVTIVSAPTGAGKTALVAAAARAFSQAAAPGSAAVGSAAVGSAALGSAALGSAALGSAAWCTLGADDNQPHAFGLSVLDAVLAARTPVELGQAAVAIGASAEPLDEALRIAGHGAPLMLVLDDCENLHPAATHATVGRLIRQLPMSVAVVLIANQDVDLPARLRASTRIRELRAVDLAFDAADVRALFEAEGVSIPADVVDGLVAWTAGLPSAIRLALEAFRSTDDAPSLLAALLRSESAPHLALFSHAIATLADDERRFLTATAIVDPICAPLAAALTGSADAGPYLHDITARDLFLDSVPGCPGWYRHRRLKRELLLADLRHSDADAVPSLHAYAARWYDGHGLTEHALTHALHGNDVELVSNIVQRRWIEESLVDADSSLVHVPRLPAGLATDTLDRALVASLFDLEHGDSVAARAMLIRLQLEARDAGDDHADDIGLLEPLLALRIAREDADPLEIERAANEVMKRFAGPGISATELEDASSLAHRSLAEADLLRGDLVNAANVLESVIDEGLRHGRELPVFDATASLALVTALGGRVRRAAALADELGDTWSRRSRRSSGMLALTHAICSYHRDALPAAQDAASEARRDLPPGVFGDVVLPVVRARIAASAGDTDAAKRLLERAVSTGHEELVWMLRDAFGLAEPQWEAGVRRGGVVTHPYALALVYLRESVTSYSRDDRDAAVSAMDNALGLVERNEYRRVLLDSGLPVRPVLLEYVKEARPFGPTAWQSLHRLPGDATETRQAIVETLTERELTVLRYLPTMMSNREIAAEMFFSVNTVKTHLKSIYRKLGVSRRRDAVSRARALSLL
jgi:LuxR family maltose regulon positive regulatory protein